MIDGVIKSFNQPSPITHSSLFTNHSSPIMAVAKPNFRWGVFQICRASDGLIRVVSSALLILRYGFFTDHRGGMVEWACSLFQVKSSKARHIYSSISSSPTESYCRVDNWLVWNLSEIFGIDSVCLWAWIQRLHVRSSIARFEWKMACRTTIDMDT